MAKRFKIKGNPPRGFSKSARQTIARVRERDREDLKKGHTVFVSYDDDLAKLPGIGRGATRPSSTRKKLVKQGSRKFIGPRELKSELREDSDARWRDLNSEFVPPAAMSKAELRAELENVRVMRRNMGKKVARLRGSKGTPKKSRARFEIYGKGREPDFGVGGISKSQRLKNLFSRVRQKFEDSDEYYPRDPID